MKNFLKKLLWTKEPFETINRFLFSSIYANNRFYTLPRFGHILLMFGSDLPCYLCFFFIYPLNSCYSPSFCLWFLGMLKSSRPDVFRKGILRNFTKFIGKSLSNFIEKEALAQVVSYEFYTCFRRTPLVPASESFVVISFVS